jgi:hypothetical protein
MACWCRTGLSRDRTRTSARSQNRSRCSRWLAASASNPSPATRSRVRRYRPISSGTGTLREIWYAAYLVTWIGTPGCACVVTATSPVSSATEATAW